MMTHTTAVLNSIAAQVHLRSTRPMLDKAAIVAEAESDAAYFLSGETFHPKSNLIDPWIDASLDLLAQRISTHQAQLVPGLRWHYTAQVYRATFRCSVEGKVQP